MRRAWLCGFCGFVLCMLLSSTVLASSHNPADYPLRVHIFHHSSHSHYYWHTLDQVDGEGRANLFENGDPHGFDFRYDCGNRLMNSAGYETYLARWKKPGQKLEILLPAGGGTCNLQVDVKADIVYRKHNGELGEEPAAKYKAWMIKHQYDPEHGKNEPVAPEPSETPAAGTMPVETGTGAPGQSAPQ